MPLPRGLRRGHDDACAESVVAAVALLIALPAVAQDRRGDEQTERISRKFKIGATGRLALANISGDIVVTAGAGDEVTLEAVKRTRGDAKRAVQRGDRHRRAAGTRRHPDPAHRTTRSVERRLHRHRAPRRDRRSVVDLGRRACDESAGAAARTEHQRRWWRRPDRPTWSRQVDLRRRRAERIGAEARITGSTVSGTVRARDVRTRALSRLGDQRKRRGQQRRGGTAGSEDRQRRRDLRRRRRSQRTLRVQHAFGQRAPDARQRPRVRAQRNTFSGNVRSDLPVTINDVRSRRGPGRSIRAVVVGDSGATLTVSTFSGNVVIRRQ